MAAEINVAGVRLPLHQAIGSVRIADEDGNHAPRPTQTAYSKNSYVEWMITNEEIGKLMEKFLKKEERAELSSKISEVREFIRESQYATRETKKAATEETTKIAEFRVHKNVETFYSFEKKLDSGIKIRVILKRGDYTLTPFMFVLLPFSLPGVKIMNQTGEVKEGALGSGCYCTWKPDKKDVHEIVVGLSHASKDHLGALKGIIRDLN